MTGTRAGEELVSTDQDVAELAQQLRVDSIRFSTSAGSGHPTSSMSAADLMATLLARHLCLDWSEPDNPANDHLIFSKGHASPLLYAMFKAAGVVSDETLMTRYRRVGSPWTGHPTPALPWVDVATGSLGQGLPAAVGIAMAGRFLDHTDYHVWVLCGDSEMAEGSMWEAIEKAGFFDLGNLTAIVDVNEFGMRGRTALGADLATYAARVRSFGCRPLIADGHDVSAVDEALRDAHADGLPTVVLARTRKGHGVADVEARNGWHGKPMDQELAERAIAELGGVRDLRVQNHVPARRGADVRLSPVAAPAVPHYPLGARIATRTAYGESITALGADPRVVVVDAEVGNSTHAELFQQAYPDRYFDVFTAEQQMLGTAVGFSVRGYIPFAATFAAFLTRAHDFIRMAAISEANLRLAGSHAGVEVGPDGSSQMALEDLAMMRAVHGSTVLYPSDATSTARLVESMHALRGVVYLRTTRGAYPVLYGPEEKFPIPGAKVVRSSAADSVTLVGAGVTLHNCLEAADMLAEHGVSARVIDAYSVKPLDVATMTDAIRHTGGRVVIVEDHHPEGGLGEAVLTALSNEGLDVRTEHLAVRIMPTSGTPDDLMGEARIAAADIVAAAARLCGSPVLEGLSP